MIKEVSIKKNEFESLILGIQNTIILNTDDIQNMDNIKLINEYTKESIEATVTSSNKYNSIEDVMKVIPYKLFGNFDTKEDVIRYYTDMNNKIINVCRIKIEKSSDLKIIDKQLLKLIDIESFEKNNIGHSVCDVIKVKLKDSKEAILKIQTLPSRSSIYDEFTRLEWLQGKINCPKIYYWSEKNNIKYLLTEFKEGNPAFMYEDIGYRLGKELKELHNLNISNCEFLNNDVDILLNNAISKIDAIMPQISEIYPNENKEDIINFLKDNKPKDRVLIHGDFSLPNILINEKNDEYIFIDLGEVSISTKYFDFYYAIKSFIRNNKENQIERFIEGYGIQNLEDKYMKWMDIIDKSLF